MKIESLLVNKRRGKEKDKGCKGPKSDNWEEISPEITDSGSDHVGGRGNLGEVGHVLDHVDLRCFPGDEGRSNCK